MEKNEQTKNDSESKNIKPKEKDESTIINSDESRKQKPVKEVKQTSLKGKKRLSSQDEEESPVKSKPKKQKKRAVIESDSEEETSVEAEDEKKYKPETEESKPKSPKKESPL